MPDGLSPAAELRAAARHMQEHHGPDHPRHEFWAGVASFLEETAADSHSSLPWWVEQAALKIARDYLESVR